MSKNMFKILCFLLSASIATGYLFSCGESKTEDTDTGDITTKAETTPEDSRLTIPDDLPERNYEGYEFRILTYSPKNYFIEEETGDVVEDSIYKRNMLVEERFGVEISAITSPDISQLDATLKTSVMAGEDAFDLAIPHQITSGPGLITGNYIRDWNDVEYINTQKPWWNQTIIETINILGRQYYLAGYISNPSPFCLMYNKQYVIDYGFENLYDVINEGRWTLDYMTSLTKQVSSDLNGDGTFGPEDQYGISINNDNQTLNFMYASNMHSVIIDNDGKPVPNVLNDKMITLVNKIYDLINSDHQALITTYANQAELGVGGFKEGRIFLLGGNVGSAANLRDTEVDFGLIPYPKFDEQQDTYNTHVDASNGMLCIPMTAENLERTGIITEALAAYSYKYVTPAYYDIALGTKYLRDMESVEMLNLIFDGIIYDFGYIFDRWQGCTWTLVNLMKENSTDLVSYWAQKESAVIKHYEDLYKAVLEN